MRISSVKLHVGKRLTTSLYFLHLGYIPPPTLSKSERSRLQSLNDEDDEEEETIEFDKTSDYDTEAVEVATEPDQDVIHFNHVSTTETVTTSSLNKTLDNVSTTEITVQTTTQSSTEVSEASTQEVKETTRTTTTERSDRSTTVRHSTPATNAKEEDDWRPIIMQSNVKPVVSPEESFAVLTDDANLANHNLDELSHNLDSKVKSDRVIEVDTKSGPNSSDDDDTALESSPNKFSFLQWFNTQLNNAKLRTNSTTPSPLGTTSTRFFTLRPTAVSYSGVQPVHRQRPWVSPVDLTAATRNRTGHEPSGDGAVLRPFVIQTSLTLQKPPSVVNTGSGFLVESPRSQKSLPLDDSIETRLKSDESNATERSQGPGVLLKDFFPPVRRPVSRPQITRSGDESEVSQTSLPIEALFSKSTSSSQTVRLGSNRAQGSVNSPIYTFRLSQGQNVHDVLSQLLADLTTGDGPAVIDIDNRPIMSPTMENRSGNKSEHHDDNNKHVDVITSPEDNGNDKKVSHKKIEDDRLRPWGQLPFRPPILNALHQNLRNNNSGTGPSGTGANVSENKDGVTQPNANSSSVATVISGNHALSNSSGNFLFLHLRNLDLLSRP